MKAKFQIRRGVGNRIDRHSEKCPHTHNTLTHLLCMGEDDKSEASGDSIASHDLTGLDRAILGEVGSEVF